MTVAAKIKIADARAELGMSQQALAFWSHLSKQTIVSAEKGMAIQRLTAYAILKGLNAGRKENGMPPLTIAEIDFKIVGE